MTAADTKIIGLRVEGRMTVYELRPHQRAYVIGSSQSADLRVAFDCTVSRMHCALLRERDGTLLVIDQDSRNGTFIGHTRVRQAYLADGDRLRVGRTVLVAFSQKSREAMSEREARRALRAAVASAMARGSMRVAAKSLGIATTVLRQLARGTR